MRLLILASALGLSACTALQRSPESGYHAPGARDGGGVDVWSKAFGPREAFVRRDAREELGYGTRPLSGDEGEALALRVRLKHAEARIPSKREREQYYGVRADLRDDRERLYFLSLPTLEARGRWASRRDVRTKEEDRSDEVARAIEANDIAIGMTQQAVSESWGDPDAVETAGNPLYRMELWKYTRYVSGHDGYQKELRVVYFEGGRVTGWQRL